MIRLHGLLRLSALFVAIATATTAHALGVGEVKLNSRLNQPLNAQIALFEANGLDSEEIIVKLASPEAFDRVGLDRPYFLTDLKFNPKLQGAQGNIIVTSSKPVREPYLSFLIEVIWPNGRMLREYTLLLDPPIYAPAQPAATTAPAQTVAQSPATAPVQQPPRETEEAPSQHAEREAITSEPEPVQVATSSSAMPAGQYQTQNNDTLWEIANNFGVPGSSVHQTMLAIQDLNPQAFINNNINLLKKGQVLRLPDEEQINSRTAAAAFKEVAQQNNAWRESKGQAAERQINATARQTNDADGQTEQGDSLRLVSATATSQGVSALNERLAAAQENLDSSRRENEDLKGRVSDLEEQLEKLQRLVELKDASLAKLQSQLADAEANAAAVDSTPTPPQNHFSEPESERGSPPASYGIDEDISFSDPSAETFPDISSETIATPEAGQEEQKWWESLLADNPMLLAGAGGGLLLALLLLMIRTRNNARKWAEREQLEADLAAEEAQHHADFADDLHLPDSSFDDPLPEYEDSFDAPEQKKSTQAPESVLTQDMTPHKPALSEQSPAAVVNNLAHADTLDDFADFDLSFDDKPLSSDKTDSSEQRHQQTKSTASITPAPSLSKDDEFDFVLSDKSESAVMDDFDDFALADEDNAPIVEMADSDSHPQEILDDLSFDMLSESSSAQATEAPPTEPGKAQSSKPTNQFQAADDDFDFLSGTDETETKLDLARAYIDMGDMEGARDILDEVMSEGSDSQRSEAQELMTSLA